MNREYIFKYIYIKAILLFIFIGLVALSWFAFSANRSDVCKVDNRLIHFKRLSNEKAFPFLLFNGSPLSNWNNKRIDYVDYKASVAHFFDVRSCLKDSEKEKQAPNLNRFDWDKIRSTYDADVCLFRIFSSIGSVEGFKQWLESQGFKISVLYDGVSGKDLRANEMPGISAHWNTEECGLRFSSSRLWDLWHLWEAHPLSVEVLFTPDGEVSDTGVGYNMK